MKQLKPAEFHILVALAGGPGHGLGIAEQVEEATDGATRLGPATLYRSLRQLAERGLIEESAPPPGEDDPRRRFFAITAAGREEAGAEADRLRSLLDFAARNRVIEDRRG